MYIFVYLLISKRTHTSISKLACVGEPPAVIEFEREKRQTETKRERMEECETTVDALVVSDKSKQVHSALPRLKYTSANFELIKNMQYIHIYICMQIV